MDDTASEKSPKGDANNDLRVKVASKKEVVEQIKKYAELLQTALDGQEVAEDTKRVLVQELLANFESAVQENVSVNGLSWEEAPDEEEEGRDLDNLLDDTIVETTGKRRTFPKRILPHVLHTLKAQRHILGLYEKALKPPEMKKDPHHESMVRDLSAVAPLTLNQAAEAQKQAEGLARVLNSKPTQTTLEIQREVFGQSHAPLPSVGGASRSRQPIRIAVEESVYANCYVPQAKKQGCETQS